MFIGLLTNKSAGTDIKYSYKNRVTGERLNPMLLTEETEKDIYDKGGRLFTGYVGYNEYILLYGTVDIDISLGKTVYVDNLELRQQRGSALGDITVLKKVGKKEIKVGACHAETGKCIESGKVTVKVGTYTDNLILRIKAECRKILIGKLCIYGAADICDAVYPFPEKAAYTGGYFEGEMGVTGIHGEESAAALNFTEKYLETYGGEIKYGAGDISFELGDLGAEEFDISVTKEKIKVIGGSRRALLWASEKLLQLADGGNIKCARIHDKPFMKYRGVHIALPSRENIPFIKNIVRCVLMPMGYNQLIIQVSGAMEYKKHPEINEAWLEMCREYEAGRWPLPAHYNFIGHDVLTQDEVSELCDYMRYYGLDVIPEVQSFGHVQYITQAYPELGEEKSINQEEFDLTAEDARPADFYIHTMCPNHPDYYKVIFDVMDEAIDVIKPTKYVHIGHDEIYTIGKCDRCKSIPAYEIYAKEVTMLHDHIAEKGLTTMMWSDMIQGESYSVPEAIDMIPKDIVCLSFTWYFHVDKDVEELLYEHGFDVMIGNFYSSHFPRFNKRKYGKRLLGAQVSTWIPQNELYYGYEGKMFDLIYSAGMLWSGEYHDNTRLTYTEIVKNVILSLKKRVSEHWMSPNAAHVDFPKKAKNVPAELKDEFKGAAAIDAEAELSIPVSLMAERVAFLTSTSDRGDRIMWQAPKKLGEYVFTYDDGVTVKDDILYGANIAEYARVYGAPLSTGENKISAFRHEGYFATYLADPVTGKMFDGGDYTLYEYTWSNPRPEHKIVNIEIRHSKDNRLKILVYDIKAE